MNTHRSPKPIFGITLMVILFAAAGALGFRALTGRSTSGLTPTGGQALTAGVAALGASAVDPNAPDPLCRHQPVINGLDSWVERCGTRSSLAGEGGLPATGDGLQEATCSHPPSVSGLDSWVTQCGSVPK